MSMTAPETMTATEFFAITEPYGWGTKTTNYKVIEKDLLKKLPPEKVKGLSDALRTLTGKLWEAVREWAYETGYDDYIGGDSGDDCAAHVIGLGKAEYEACLKDPGRFIKRYEEGKFKESFSYAIPYESSLEKLDPAAYSKRMKKVIDAYHRLANSSLKKVPALPRIKADLETVMDALHDYMVTGNLPALLAREEEVKKASENVGKVLNSVDEPSGDMDLLDANNYCANKWAVWNVLTDLKDYLT